MPITTSALPLSALRAVALDTETTGLDAKVARIIEIGATPVDGEQIGPETVSTFVACDVPIPASSTAIHGLTAADLVGAPSFPEAWASLQPLMQDRIWLGYAIGFDVAVFRQACTNAGIAWKEPQTLDVRLLVQALAPRLPDFSLEAIADWLKVPVANRHRALADAQIAAGIFIAILPRLRTKGVHTVGDALGVCRRLSENSAWPISVTGSEDEKPGEERVDSYPYRHVVRDLMSHPPAFAASDTSLQAAIRTMTERKFSSLYVGDPDALAAKVGILTERDAMRAIARDGTEALLRPISDYATQGLATVPDDAFVYRAIGRMARRKIRHLAVVGGTGRVVGALSARDLLRLRASAAIELGDDIEEATSVAQLGRAWSKLAGMAEALLRDDVPARDISAIVAAEVCAATAKAATLAEQEMRDLGSGGPPCPYAVLVLGSAGRGESLLAMDQDNALVFATGEPDGPEDQWFAGFGARMCEILDRIGIPLCKGGVMASQPDYRGSAALWRERIVHWVSRSNPQDLLSVDIFFDLRPVHGDLALAHELRGQAWAEARPQKAFLKLLASNGEGVENPLGFLGGWKVGPDGRFDLKLAGLKSLVTAARVLAISEGHVLYSTRDRLQAMVATARGATRDLEDLDRAHVAVLDAILRQQLIDLKAGAPLTNRVLPATLDRVQARRLKAALGHLSVVPTLVKDRLLD